MKKTIDFKVSINYQFFSGVSTSEALATQLETVLKAAINQNFLNAPKVYSAEKVEGVAPLVEGFSECEVDAVLCVFDEISGLLNPSRTKTTNQYLEAMVADLQKTHDNGGTPAIRVLAMGIGKIIENVWQELTALGYDEKFQGAWDFEFVPELMLTVHANHNEFPTAESTGAWRNAALGMLEVEQDEYNLKKLAHDNPEFALNLRAAANTFKAALDFIGADKLSGFSSQSSSSILEELETLANTFKADQV